ncbi:type IV pilus modification PilV family protein [Usitatibacter palustris]|uniref:Prepilin-type N-terminal cleavage/methylation domain-containing protein n=1 Tax=Usitatibacter palustris TaxID=2732487 RepID=A0A6M4HEP0_9PROT|nr:type II secretion system protein [Usitatibacter palustris]QJR16477.1 hypothetical protein DSM104440_03312 [Usitatibacter palustris]
MRARSQGGFTLLEVVVAFMVLALTVTTIFQIFSTGLSRSGDLEAYSEALAVAQTKLAVVGVEEPLKEGATNGETDDRRYKWSVTVGRHEEIAEGQTTIPPATYSMYRVDARVNWRTSDGRDREISLSTLTLGPRT